MVSWQVSPRDRMVLDGVEYEVIGEPEQYNHSPFGSMGNFPTPFLVGHRRFDTGAQDAHGNPVAFWFPEDLIPAHGWAVPRTDEPKLAGHDRDVVEVELFVPECRVINLRRVNG